MRLRIPMLRPGRRVLSTRPSGREKERRRGKQFSICIPSMPEILYFQRGPEALLLSDLFHAFAAQFRTKGET